MRRWPRGEALTLASLLLLALVFRLLAVRALPVVFDEVCVMAYGLARASRGARALLFEVPIAVSNGITPLWFWVQSVPAALFEETTKAGLRALPVLLGLLAVGLTWRECGALAGRRAAAIGGFLAAVHGPYLFANARGEYSESLLVALVLLLLGDLRLAGGALPSWRAAAWPALALFTYLGKGVLVWAGYALYVALLYVLRARAGPRSQVEVHRVLSLVVLPLLPSLVWLLAAHIALFGAGATVVTDLGPVDTIVTNLRRLTTGYGSEAQRFMVGRPVDALFVYTDFDAWPTLALLAVPALWAIGRGLRDLGRALRERDVSAAVLPLRLLCLVLVPAGVIVARGALDVRFHLLFWPVLLVYCAVEIEDWIRELGPRRVRGLLVAGLVAYVAWTQRGSAPVVRVGWAATGAAVALLAWSHGRWGKPAPGLVLAPLALVMLLASALKGPLDWGRRWAWEPSPIPADVPRAVTTFPNVDLQLVECALGRESLAEARPFLRRALDRHPGDRETVLRVGEALLEGDVGDARSALVPLGEWSRRHPEDAEARALLERALAAAGGP